MQYLDFERLEAIDPHAYQTQKPYPWVNPERLITDEGYEALMDTLPELSLFEKVYGLRRAHGQLPHDRYNLEYSPDLPLADPWKTFMGELTNGRYERALCRILGCERLNLRFHWHYQPAGCAVSPHCDSLKKAGSHLFYLNREEEWDPSWGGQTLVLDDGGRFDRTSAPDFDEFEDIIASQASGNRSFLFTQQHNSWHGVEEIRSSAGEMRRVLIVVLEHVRPFQRIQTFFSRRRGGLSAGLRAFLWAEGSPPG